MKAVIDAMNLKTLSITYHQGLHPSTSSRDSRFLKMLGLSILKIYIQR